MTTGMVSTYVVSVTCSGNRFRDMTWHDHRNLYTYSVTCSDSMLGDMTWHVNRNDLYTHTVSPVLTACWETWHDNRNDLYTHSVTCSDSMLGDMMWHDITTGMISTHTVSPVLTACWETWHDMTTGMISTHTVSPVLAACWETWHDMTWQQEWSLHTQCHLFWQHVGRHDSQLHCGQLHRDSVLSILLLLHLQHRVSLLWSHTMHSTQCGSTSSQSVYVFSTVSRCSSQTQCTALSVGLHLVNLSAYVFGTVSCPSSHTQCTTLTMGLHLVCLCLCLQHRVPPALKWRP